MGNKIVTKLLHIYYISTIYQCNKIFTKILQHPESKENRYIVAI